MADYCSMYTTTLGTGGVVANDHGLVTVLLPDPRGLEVTAPQWCQRLDELEESPLSRTAADLLRRYFDGERVTFALPLDDRGWTDFGAMVYGVTRAIPYGEVRSYGEVAMACGHPGAARAVGRFMATNRLPIVVPCHRVVAASGALTGYSGPGGLPFKANLLRMEGITLLGEQKVCW